MCCTASSGRCCVTAPRGIVVYVGDNDLASGTGKTAESIAAQFETLVGRVHAALPEARIFFLTIKPSPLRWDRWPEMQRANEIITQIAAGRCRGWR